MTGDLLFWLGWLGAALLYVVMIYIAWRALFGDQARGKRRCSRCWHDLSHTPGMTCSECGFTAQREVQFHKTRRHKSLALLAMLICLGPAVYLNWKIDQRGWVGVVPTKALIWTLPLTIADGSEAVTELERRMRADDLSDGEWLSVLQRCAEGDMWREPPSDEWAQTYGQMLRPWPNQLAATLVTDIATERGAGELNGPAARFARSLDELLLEIPPRMLAMTRSDWPRRIEARVNISLDDWWPVDCEARMHITPQVSGATSTLVYSSSVLQQNAPFSLAVPPFEANELNLKVQVERRRGPEDQWNVVDEQTVAVRMTASSDEAAEDDAAGVMGIVIDPAVDAAMQRAFGQGVVHWTTGSSPVRFYVRVPETAGSEFADTAVGVKVELKYGEELARRLDLWWMGGGPADLRYGFEIAYENTTLLQSLQQYNPATDAESWTLTVTGDEAIAFRAGPAEKYWAGRVVIPMVLTSGTGAAPPRPWWTQEQLDEEAVGEYSSLE